MGLFFGNIIRRPLSELQVDGKEVEDKNASNAATDYTKDEDDDTGVKAKKPEDLKPADPTGDPAPKQEEPKQTPNDAPEDYTIPDTADQAAPEPKAAEATPATPAAAEPATPATATPATAEPAGETPAADDTTTDYTQDTDGDDAPPADQDTGDAPKEDSGVTDYTQDADGDGTADTTDAPAGDTGSTPSTPSTDNDTPGQTEEEIRKIEEELFSNLSTEQIAVKNSELKNQYVEMFDVTTSLVDKINDIPKNDQTTKILEFVSDKLSELRKMMSDYITNVYSTVSYMENAINYNKYLAVLNGINKILSELVAKSK